jgi:hypothetical protein
MRAEMLEQPVAPRASSWPPCRRRSSRSWRIPTPQPGSRIAGAPLSVLAEGISAADLRHGPTVCGSPRAALRLPEAVPEALAVFPATVRAQQLALALADELGLEADAPAGLTKVTPTQ